MEKHFLTDVQKLSSGLIIFRRSDVQHKNWYCRVKVPKTNRYKTISLKTPDEREAKNMALRHEVAIDIKVENQVPIFDKTFAEVAKEFSDLQKRKATIGEITMDRWDTVDGHIRLHLMLPRVPSFPLRPKKDGITTVSYKLIQSILKYSTAFMKTGRQSMDFSVPVVC